MTARKAAYRQHSKKRAIERCGVHCTKALRRALIHKIQSGDARAKRATSTRTIYTLEHAGRTFRVLFSRSLQEIVTFLPPDGQAIRIKEK